MAQLIHTADGLAAFSILYWATMDLLIDLLIAHNPLLAPPLATFWPLFRDVAFYPFLFRNPFLYIRRDLMPLSASSPEMVLETVFYMRLMGMTVVANAVRGATPRMRMRRGLLVRGLARISDNCLLMQWVIFCLVRFFFAPALHVFVFLFVFRGGGSKC